MRRSSQTRSVRVKRRKRPGPGRLVRMLVAGCCNPAEMVELHYWSREPGMIDIVRAVVAMPEETRSALEAFIALAHSPKSIEAKLGPRGILTLASPDASRTVALAEYVAENDAEDAARMLN